MEQRGTRPAGSRCVNGTNDPNTGWAGFLYMISGCEKEERTKLCDPRSGLSKLPYGRYVCNVPSRFGDLKSRLASPFRDGESVT